jgi:hypothetical protein
VRFRTPGDAFPWHRRRTLSSAPQDVYERLIQRAAAEVGGTEVLAQRLGISVSQIKAWLERREHPAMPMVLRMLEIVLDA